MEFNIDVLIVDISNGSCTLSTPSKNLETVSPERAAAAARDPRTAVLMFDSSSGCEHWETALPTNKEHSLCHKLVPFIQAQRHYKSCLRKEHTKGEKWASFFENEDIPDTM